MDPNEMKTQLEQVRDAGLQAFEQLRSEWKQHYDELKAQGAPIPQIQEKLANALRALDEVQAKLSAPVDAASSPYTTKSVGQQLVENMDFQAWVKRPKHKGGMAVPINTFFPEVKTTITTTAVGSSTPGILVPQRVPGIVKPGVRRLRVRDLLPRFPTTNNAIEFVKENVFTNAASPQTEASDKAESALTFTIDSSAVRTLAHWIPATRQVLDDFSALQAYVDQRLIDGLMDIEDYELLRGPGTGVHISGLITESTSYNTADNISGDTYIDQLNHAIKQIDVLDLTADGIVLNPSDWRKIQLIKTNDPSANAGPYILGGPQGTTSPILWGLPVATTTAMPVGEFLVGAFQTAAAVWDRMAANIDVSTEHSDFFIKNMVAIRAEERLALTVYRATSFIHGAFV